MVCIIVSWKICALWLVSPIGHCDWSAQNLWLNCISVLFMLLELRRFHRDVYIWLDKGHWKKGEVCLPCQARKRWWLQISLSGLNTRDLYNTYILHTSCIHLTYPTCTLGVVKKHEKCDWNDLRCFYCFFPSTMTENTLISLYNVR